MNETTERLVRLETDIEYIKGQLSEIKTSQDEKFSEIKTSQDEKFSEIKTSQDKLQDSMRMIERDHSEHKGMLIGAKWMISVTLLVLAACGGIAGAVVSHLLK